MVQGYPNILMDPDPFFDEWMAASVEEDGGSNNNNIEQQTTSATVQDGSLDVEAEEEDGITILSSVPSHNCDESAASADSLPQDDDEVAATNNNNANSASLVEIEGAEILPAGSSSQRRQEPFGGDSLLSMSTAESMYWCQNSDIVIEGNVPPPQPPQERLGDNTNSLLSAPNDLSLNPSSVPSSQLEQLPSVAPSSVASSSCSSLESLPDIMESSPAPTGCIADSPTEEAHDHHQHQQDTGIQPPQSHESRREIGDTMPSNDSVPDWFATRMESSSEVEWETWRKEMLGVLAVLGEHQGNDDAEGGQLRDILQNGSVASTDPDVLLSALFAQQQDLLEETERRRQRRSFLWKGLCWTAGAMAMALVAVAGVPRQARRRI